MNIQDVSGNDIEVIIEDIPEKETLQVTDVSGSDTHIESAHSISGGDSYNVTVLQTVETDNMEILDSMSALNYAVNALLFFMVFAWVEPKIHSGVRRLAETWKK